MPANTFNAAQPSPVLATVAGPLRPGTDRNGHPVTVAKLIYTDPAAVANHEPLLDACSIITVHITGELSAHAARCLELGAPLKLTPSEPIGVIIALDCPITVPADAIRITAPIMPG